MCITHFCKPTLWYYSPVDIDECANGTLCDFNAMCINEMGSYFCDCNIGYTGNGVLCQGRSSVYVDMFQDVVMCNSTCVCRY